MHRWGSLEKATTLGKQKAAGKEEDQRGGGWAPRKKALARFSRSRAGLLTKATMAATRLQGHGSMEYTQAGKEQLIS